MGAAAPVTLKPTVRRSAAGGPDAKNCSDFLVKTHRHEYISGHDLIDSHKFYEIIPILTRYNVS